MSRYEMTTADVRMFVDMHRKGMNIQTIALHTGRCPKTVTKYLRSMGVDTSRNAHSSRKNAYGFSELRTIITMYREGASIKAIAEAVGRSKYGINCKLRRHVDKRVKGLSKEQRKFVQQNYGKMTSRQIGEAIGMNPANVRMHCASMGLTQPRKVVWTPEKTEWLKANYSDMDNTAIAKHLDLSVGAVNAKSFKLGLKKSDEYSAKFRREIGKKCIEKARTARLSMLAAEREAKKKMREKQKKEAKKQSQRQVFAVNPFMI